MNFDFEKYLTLRDAMLLKLEGIKFFLEYQDAVSDMCEFLHIAKVEVEFFGSYADIKLGISKLFTFYENEKKETGAYYKKSENVKDEFLSKWKIYCEKGYEWTVEEKKRVVIFQKSISVFYSRSNALISLESSIYRDKEFKLLSIKYLRKTLNEIILSKRNEEFGICYYNIKHFSVINQMMSHDEADRVLISHARGIEKVLGGEGCVVRNGGDNFYALFERSNFDKVKAYLEDAELSFNKNNEKSSEGKKSTISVSTRAGFYLLTREDYSVPEIFDKVNTAYRESRNPNSVNSILYDCEIQKKQENKEFVETNFEEAINNYEFKVFYQPKVNLKNYHLAGAEALCRWFHNGQLIPPCDFIPVLEQNNAICDLDFYILERVCSDISTWIKEGKRVVKISVNLSRQHLGNKNLFSKIIGIIDRYEVPHNLIEIELTETTTDVDFKDMKAIVIPLRDAGIGTSIDDFGCGYSSLNMMRSLPWSILKIDRSFLYGEDNGNSIGNSKSEPEIMLHHIISMAKEHGLECIVEGVETIEHVKLLKKNNCFLAQGYYFDRPLNKDDFEKRLDKIGRI